MKLASPKDMAFLIVDDVDNMRRSTKAMLKLIHFGRAYYEATNGQEAWNLLISDEVSIDFIICDYNMPRMTGTELLSLIRANGKTREIPFLMVTAEANMDVVAEAAEHDVDAYMTKPFVTAALEQKINELLDQLRNPSPFTLSLRAARQLEEQGNLDGAIAMLEKAAGLNELSSRPLREQGMLFLKKKEAGKAITCFEKALSINRLDVASYHALGQIYSLKGRMDLAMDNFNRAVEISPRHVDRAVDFARLLIKKGKLPEAEKVLRLTLKTKGGDPFFKESIIDLCNEYGLGALAFKCCRELQKVVAPNQRGLKKKTGIALYHVGNYPEACALLEKAAKEKDDDFEALFFLGKSYLARKMLSRADQCFTLALRLKPEHKEARALLDQCL